MHLTKETLLKRSNFAAQPEARHFVLDPTEVPTDIRAILHYAEVWGQGDDGVRNDLVEQADDDLLKDLTNVAHEYGDQIDEFLRLPASRGLESYYAFSYLLIASQEAKEEMRIRAV